MYTNTYKVIHAIVELSKFQAAYGITVYVVPTVHVANSEPWMHHCFLMEVPGNPWIHCVFDFELVFGHCAFRNLLFLPVFGESHMHSQTIFEEL